MVLRRAGAADASFGGIMSHRLLCSVVQTAVAIVSAVGALADTPASPPPPCSSPEHRQFDFWVGDWEVRDPQGQLQGANLITKEFGGCVIQEHWAGPGMSGGSFNIYAASTGRWHQSWVDTNGTLLLLDGSFKDGKMQLAGEGMRGGKKTWHRISWEPKSGGTVRQLWEVSSDGSTWSVAFDGLYEKKKSG